jgi:hypothetical protein
MPRVFPFEALVYDVAIAGTLDRVTTPPYDVISESLQRAYRAEPLNIVQIDSGAGDDRAGYERAGSSTRGSTKGSSSDGTRVPCIRDAPSPTERVRGPLRHGSAGWARSAPHGDHGGTRRGSPPMLRATHTHLSAGTAPSAARAPRWRSPSDVTSFLDEPSTNKGCRIAATIPSNVPIGEWLADEPFRSRTGAIVTRPRWRIATRCEPRPGPGCGTAADVRRRRLERLSVRPSIVQLTGATLSPASGGRSRGARGLSDDDLRVGSSVRTGGRGAQHEGLTGEPPTRAPTKPSMRSPRRIAPLHPEAVEAVAAVTSERRRRLPPAAHNARPVRKVVEREERLREVDVFLAGPRTGASSCR